MSDTVENEKKEEVKKPTTSKKKTTKVEVVYNENHKSKNGMDLTILFYITAVITICMMVAQFIVTKNNITLGIEILYSLPITTFIQALYTYMGIIGGTEGGRSFLTSVGLPKGEVAAPPEYKIKQFLSFLITFMVLCIVSVLFQSFIGSSQPSFGVEDTANGVFTGLVAYAVMRTGGKLGQNFDFLNKSKTKDATTPTSE